MKAILLSCLLLAAVLAEEYHFYHYTGADMLVSNQPKVKVDGPIFVEFLKTINITAIAGMHISGKTHTAFGIIGNITNITVKGDEVEITAKCWEIGWGLKNLEQISGVISAKGSWKKALKWKGDCYSAKEKMMFNITANGVYAKCPFYLPYDASKRAHMLIGEPAETYKNINVLNFAIMGYPYIDSIKNCTFWVKNFDQTNLTKPGVVVVGKDGLHCGIIDQEGDKFIHTDAAKKKVAATPLTEAMLKNFFPKGHLFKDYKC